MSTIHTLPRDTDGKLSAYAWPGAYPIYYYDLENAVLCPDCANKMETDSGWSIEQMPAAFDLNFEDVHLTCEQCYQYIDPAYITDNDLTNARAGILPEYE